MGRREVENLQRIEEQKQTAHELAALEDQIDHDGGDEVTYIAVGAGEWDANGDPVRFYVIGCNDEDEGLEDYALEHTERETAVGDARYRASNMNLEAWWCDESGPREQLWPPT